MIEVTFIRDESDGRAQTFDWKPVFIENPIPNGSPLIVRLTWSYIPPEGAEVFLFEDIRTYLVYKINYRRDGATVYIREKDKPLPREATRI